MANPQLQRELIQLEINMKEEQLSAEHGGWRLRAKQSKMAQLHHYHDQEPVVYC